MLTEAGKKKAGFEKIKKCGQTALAHGIHYIWVDTCCIDKSSSAELSEAISSMSRWYADAKICYAYLADVYMPKNYSDEDTEALPESLRQSDWFKRGWTLQELIFPKQLLFYTKHWDRIASRRMISKALSDITGISSELLSASNPRTDIDRHKFPSTSGKCLAWLECAWKGSPNRIAITLMHLIPTGTYIMLRRRHRKSPSAPLNAARETILLDDFTSYSALAYSQGPASFALQPTKLSQLYRFHLQEIFPDAGWISKLQTIIPYETSPGDGRFGGRIIRPQPKQCEFAVIGGFVANDEENSTWCELIHRKLDDGDLEALVRAQIPRNDSANHATIRLGEDVLSVEIIDSGRRNGFTDSEFDLRFRFKEN
jgi:hypothetical protein